MAILDLRNNSKGVQLKGLGEFDLDSIKADSKPVYDQNKILPGNQEGWGVFEWIEWHRKLKSKYSLQKANALFLRAWKNQSVWHWPYNWFKYDSDFSDYMEKNGIDVNNMISNVTSAVEDTVKNATEVVKDAGAGIKNTVGTAKVLLPIALTAIVAGAGYYVYKNYIDGDKQVSIYGKKV